MPQGPRWTQYQEDSYRLPEGFKRIGYDSDTKRYTFQDKNGVVYQGEPGLDYGTLTPVPPSHSSMESSRPSAFAATVPKRSSTLPTPEGRAPTTFHDILPPELITTSSLSESSQTSPKLPRDKFVEAVRRSALPKMQGVVSNLRRSVTSMRKPRAGTYTSGSNNNRAHEDTRGLLRHGSTSTVGLDRSSSVATFGTDMSRSSVITVRSVNHS